MTRRRLRLRFWPAAALTAVGVLLAALTVAAPDWIERLTGADPDGGSGALEWGVAAGVVLATAAGALLARAEWRRARIAVPEQ